MRTSQLHVLADENIPFAEEAFGTLGTVRLLPGRAVTPADVRRADVLLVRSVTPVGRALLEGSRVRFVGSATTGTDHVDRAYLKRAGIAFAHAPGANAGSVADYVIAALLTLAARYGEALRGKTAGLVGCGNVGGRLARRLAALGMRVLKNDPPRAAREGGEGFVSLRTVLSKADVLTLHVPLTRTSSGPYATHHLIDSTALARMKPSAWLVNTSRGAVVDNAALYAGLVDERPAAAVLDVWEGEPTPSTDLLHRAALGTPHIAGYAYDGKVQGTVMIYRALCRHLERPEAWDYEAALALDAADDVMIAAPDPARPEAAWLHRLAEQMYDVRADDARLRRLAGLPLEERGAYFSRLRREYPRRRAFARHTIPAEAVPARYRAAVEEGLGVRLT